MLVRKKSSIFTIASAMSSAISIMAAILFLSSCIKISPKMDQGKDSHKAQNDLSNLPEWILNPDVKDGVAAVGIAGKSRGGLEFQIPKAELDAKSKISAKLLSEISQVTKRALREAKVNDSDDVDDVFSQATKEVVKNMPMSGVKRINIYRDSDGTLYVHMVLKDENYGKYLDANQKLYNSRIKNSNLSQDNINKAQKAVKVLFDELEEERKKK